MWLNGKNLPTPCCCAGMRLSKIDAAKAQSTVQAAVAGGVITANADNAFIRHDANFNQPIGGTLNGSEAANFYLTKPFVDQLKNTSDPRLQAIAIRYVGATGSTTQTVAVGSTDPAKQIGMPMGKRQWHYCGPEPEPTAWPAFTITVRQTGAGS